MKHCPGKRMGQLCLLQALVFQDRHPGTNLLEKRYSRLQDHTVHQAGKPLVMQDVPSPHLQPHQVEQSLQRLVASDGSLRKI